MFAKRTNKEAVEMLNRINAAGFVLYVQGRAWGRFTSFDAAKSKAQEIQSRRPAQSSILSYDSSMYIIDESNNQKIWSA